MISHDYYRRLLKPRVLEAMADTPVVMIVGPRQSGKTTLARGLENDGLRYLTLDDETALLAARNDPIGFVRSLDKAIIDEVQRAPALLPAIKMFVDEDRRPGRFLLTGSANVMTLPTVAESLAGRMETMQLLPLSQGEISGCGQNLLDMVFAGRIPSASRPVIGRDLIDVVLRGGYPEVVKRSSIRRRRAWISQYVDALLQRDVREIAGIDKLESLPRLLKVLAAVSGRLCNYSKLGGQIGLDHKTVAKYMAVFEQMFLLRRVAAWTSNRLGRLVKTPKLHFLDTGVLAWLNGMTPEIANKDRTSFGSLLETFVYGELLKMASFSEGDFRCYHYRDKDQVEVDFIIENERAEIVGLEIKAGATVTMADTKGLLRLKAVLDEKMKLGLVLYDGKETLPVADGIYAVPLSSLWCEGRSE